MGSLEKIGNDFDCLKKKFSDDEKYDFYLTENKAANSGNISILNLVDGKYEITFGDIKIIKSKEELTPNEMDFITRNNKLDNYSNDQEKKGNTYKKITVVTQEIIKKNTDKILIKTPVVNNSNISLNPQIDYSKKSEYAENLEKNRK